ncbi:S49 family peptidase [Vibrio parahaemolyticus]
MKDLIMWCGTEDSFKNYLAFLQYCGSAEHVETRMKAFLDMDEDDDEPDYHIGQDLVEFRNDVAVITVSGTLVSGYSFWNQFFDLVSYEEIMSAVTYSVENGAKKIVLRLDSGGGDVLGLDECAQYIKAVDKQAVPIYAHTSTMACSGAYWLAASCREIAGAPMAITGSIGVIAVHMSYTEALGKAGVKATIFRAGEFKALGHPYEELTDKAAKVIQDRMTETYSFFLNHVISNRNVSLNNKDNWAEGKTFITDKSISLNLLDSKIYLSQFIEKIRVTNNNRSLSITISDNINTGSDDMGNKKIVRSAEELAALSQGAEVQVSEEVEETTTDVTDPEATTEETTEEETTTEETTDETTEEETTDEEAKTTAQVTNGICPEKYAQVLAEKSLLENKIESLTSQLEESASSTKALQKIAVAATNRLQVALHESPTDLTNVSASVVLSVYAEKEQKFNDTFKIGAASSQKVASTNENTVETSGIYPIN